MMTASAGPLLFCLLVFQHFRLVHVGSYELTLGTVAGLFLLLVLVRRTTYAATSAAWSLIIVLSGLAALSSGYSSGSAYVSTLMLFLLTSAVICSGFGSIRSEVIHSRNFKNWALVTLLLIVALSVAQVTFAKTGSSTFYNVFGSRQYFHSYNHLVGLVEFPRAQGFYLEPSYNAFVIGSLGMLLIVLKHRMKIAYILVLTGLLVTQSATALILLVAIVSIYLVRSRGLVRVVAVLAVVVVLLFSGSYLLLRLSTIGTEGSSANYRLLAPLQVLIDVLSEHPLGRPLGSVQETIATYDLFMAGVSATSLDNGYYIFVYYFGWIGMAAVLIAFVHTAVSVFKSGDRLDETWVAKVWLFGSFAFSGAVMAPEFGLTIALLIIAIRNNRMVDTTGKPTQSTAVNNHSNIQ
ncbi:hypothetical protein ACX80N_13135 [Arthrobacter sp. MDT2-16]